MPKGSYNPPYGVVQQLLRGIDIDFPRAGQQRCLSPCKGRKSLGRMAFFIPQMFYFCIGFAVAAPEGQMGEGGEGEDSVDEGDS